MSFDYAIMGNRIKIRRKELHLTQAHLAEQLNVSNNHLSSIENGREKPSFEVFLKISELLHVTPDYLLLGTINTNSVPQQIIDNLKLCSAEDIRLVQQITEFLIQRQA